MKNTGSPRTALKLNKRTRIITAITAFSLLILLLGVPAFMQSLQKGDRANTSPVERANFKDQKAQPKSRADLEAAGQGVKEQDTVAEPSVISATTNYTFTTDTNATLTDMSTGTTQLLGANIDDTASGLTVFPFDLFFQGVRYNSFSVNENGVLRFNAAAQAGSPYKPLAQAGIPILTAFGADQRTHAGDGKVHTKVTGTAPNRVLVVEWLNNQSTFNTGGTADLTYQIRLYETTGVIEYVYGKATMSTLGAADANSRDPHIGFSSTNTAGNVGSVTAAQSGTPAPTYNGASATPVANLYTAGAIPVLNTTTEGSRRIFTFTPPVPTAPSNLTFTAVTPSSYTLNWTDSPNETLYAIYRSTDGTNYSFVNTAAQNATSFNATGLNPSTTYFWQVYAVSEGALSTALSGSQATAAPGNIMSTPVGGLWSATTTWVGGVVPTATDNVTITDAATVTIDIAANAFSLNVGTGLVAPAVLQYEATTARTLTVISSVTIAGNGTFQSAATGTVTTHVLSVGGNLTNNGVLDFSTTATNVAGAGITFTGAANNTFGGTGATTDIRTITINKGTSNANILELNTSAFTVRGTTTDSTSAAYLTPTNGTLKISGTFTAAFRTFTAAAYTIPATAGFWLNNPNYTVSGQNGSPANNGLLRLTQGTYNIGTVSGNAMGGGTGAVFIVEGGTMNATGRFSPQSAVSYTQSGGTVNVSTIGHSSNAFGSFELFSASSSFTMSGGTIVIHQASTAATTPLDFDILAGTINYTGGTLQIGAADTATNFNFRINGNAPAIVINNTTNNKTATLLAQTVVFGDTTVSPGTTLNLNGFLFAQIGATLINNGTILGNTAGSRLYFAGSVAQQYSGSGVAGTIALPLQSVDFDSVVGVTFNASTTNNLITNRIIIFTGNITNANKLTLGVGGTSTGTLQIGNTTTPTNAGSFDVAPTFNLGTGGQIISYLRTTNARTTGVEINPARTLTSMTYDNNNAAHVLTIAGGDLTLSSTTTALTLTNGRVVTGSNILALSSGTATVTRTNGYVDGNLRKSYASAVSKTFEVGTANAYSPVTANVTAGTFPANFTVRAIQGKLPQISGANALARYWTLDGTGITANLTFNYLATDVTGTAANYVFIKNTGGMLSQLAPTGTPTTTSATINGVSSFSDWTLAEPGAVQSGTIQFDSATYSAGEGAGTVTLNVTRAGGSDGAVSVGYTTADGTATSGAGNDYTGQSGTLTWAAGDMASKPITVTILDDSIFEGDEAFTVNVNTPTGGATLGTPNSATVTINDNETAPTFSIDDVTHMEGDSGTTAYVFTITRTGSTALDATVSYETVDGSATSPSDFTAIPATPVTFMPADMSMQVTVFVNGDTDVEPDPETFTVHLSNPLNASILDADGTGTIENDDVAASADLTISMTDAPDPVTVDNSLIYTITVHNGGPDNATGVTLTDILPANVNFVSADSGCVESAGTVTCSIGNLANGSDAVRKITVAPTASAANTIISNTATATANETDPTTPNTATATTSVVAADCVTPPSDMVSWYSAENSGDDIQGTNNGALSGDSTYAQGKVGQAFSFGGNNGKVSAADSASLDLTQALTLDAWVFVAADAAPAGDYGIVSKYRSLGGPNDGFRSYEMYISNKKLVFRSSLCDVTSTSELPFGQWNHVAATFNGSGQCKVYIDGQLEGTQTATGNIQPNDEPFIIGAREGGDNFYFKGQIDEVELFGRDLSGTEIASIYNASTAGKCHASALQFSAATYNAAENGTSATITVTRTGAHDTTASVNYTTADGTATGGAACGAGVDYQTTSGTLNFAVGEVSKTFNVPVCDDLIFEGNETVALSLDTATGTGVSLGAPASAVLTINDDEGAPSLSVDDFTFTSADSLTASGFTVTLSHASSMTVTVHYATSDNTAIAGQDYNSASGTLTFGPGDTSKPIPVTILADNVNEPTETFFVDLDTPTNATILDGHGIGTIPNDDAVPSLSVDDVTFTNADSGISSGFTVTLSNPSSSTITVHYATSNDTALAGEDYNSASGTLTFDPGDTSKPIPVTILADNVNEPTETFFVDLDTPTNATILDGHGIGTIPNDDPPSMSISEASSVEGDSEESISFTVTLSNPPTGQQVVTVQFTTVNGTATAGATSDYLFSSGQLQFKAQQTTQDISVPINGDILDEANETFSVVLSNPSGATISDDTGVGTIIDDDLNSGDFDGDGKNDLSVFRPNDDGAGHGKWYILGSGDNSVTQQFFGDSTDLVVSADYDGDGMKEIAIFRPAEGDWYISQGSAQSFTRIHWGQNGDIPVPGDYDYDGKTDLAVFRPSTTVWYIRKSSDTTQFIARQWGLGTDRAVPSDYDGDGKTDIAVFRPTDGYWYILLSSTNQLLAVQWGVGSDKLVPADYDLDGKTDIAVWRPENGTWYIRRSSNGILLGSQWGTMGDVPVVGDYDGDGKADLTIWRPSTGDYHILESSGSGIVHTSDATASGLHWGLPGDVPIASRYIPEQ